MKAPHWLVLGGILCSGIASTYLWTDPVPPLPAATDDAASTTSESQQPEGANSNALLVNRVSQDSSGAAPPADDAIAEAIENWHPEVYKPYSEYTEEELERAGMTTTKLYGGGQGSRWTRLSLELRRGGHEGLADEARAVARDYWRVSAGRAGAELDQAMARERDLVKAIRENVELNEDESRMFERLSTAHDEMARGIGPDVEAKMRHEDDNPEGPRTIDEVDNDEDLVVEGEPRAKGKMDEGVPFEDDELPAGSPTEPPSGPSRAADSPRP